MACFQCKRTGEKICDAEEAEIRCLICNQCNIDLKNAIKEEFKNGDDNS